MINSRSLILLIITLGANVKSQDEMSELTTRGTDFSLKSTSGLTKVQQILTMGRFRVVYYNSTLISSSQFLRPFVDIVGISDLKVKAEQQEYNGLIPNDGKMPEEPDSKDNTRAGSDPDEIPKEPIGKNGDDSKVLTSSSQSSSNVILPVIIVSLIVVLSVLIVFLLRRDSLRKKQGILKISDENYLNFNDNQPTASNEKSTDGRKFHEPIQIIQNEQPAFVIDTNVETKENQPNDYVQAADLVENLDHEAAANKTPAVVVDAEVEKRQE